MEQSSMTALVCAFARAYHRENNEVRIFDDSIAMALLSKEEIAFISLNMAKGVAFFSTEFKGTQEEALRFVVDHQLSQTPLARAAFTEDCLNTAVSYGVAQYFILGAGFDSFAYRQPKWAKNLQIFEIDHPLSQKDKIERIKRAGLKIESNVHYVEADLTQNDWKSKIENQEEYDANICTFCSVLGLIYYLSRAEFESFIAKLSELIPINSSIVFDYPNENYMEEQKKHKKLANAANETMQTGYSYQEMEKILEKNHLFIFKHLNANEMNAEYFSDYNHANPEYPMEAQKNVNYCLCVKK